MYLFTCLVFYVIIIGGSTKSAYSQDTCGNVTVTLANLKFILYTRQTQSTGISLDDTTFFSNIAIDDFTTLIIHGWMQSNTKPWVILMKDAYLEKSSANIITIDWSKYSGINYLQAVCAIPKVGIIVGDFINNLTATGVSLEKIQINGLSLGAHVAGAAGQRAFSFSGSKIRRINGLDAANEEFVNKPTDERLDSSDAMFVQGIHTNSNGFGIALNYGTIDFQVGYELLLCGSKQNGCPLNPGVPTAGLILPYIFCDHIRSAAYFIESINSSKFLGVECDSCANFGNDTCNSNPKTIMGEMCPYDEKGVRYLKTNSSSPFAQG